MGQVDMLALNAEEKVVAQGLLDLQALYGTKPPDGFYWKTVVVYSYRLFAIDAFDEALNVLRIVPAEFFRGAFLEQMETEPLLAKLAHLIADKLIEAGRVATPSFNYEIGKVSVQKPGGA